MKKFRNILLTGLVVGSLIGCEDAYNITQEGQFEESIVFQSVNDLNLMLIEIYDRVGYENEIAFTSVFTDEAAIGESNGGQNLEEYRHQLNVTNGYASAIWIQKYGTISLVNRLIQGSERVAVEPGSDAEIEKNRILAEARALRALSYLQLMPYFSVDMTDDNGLGVVVYNEVPPALPAKLELPRSTNAEVFAAIEEDIAYAEANMASGNPVSLVTENLLNGMRARMANYRGDHATAMSYAQLVISSLPPANQGLTTRAQYPNMWANTITGDLIFGLERPNGKSQIVANWFFNSATLSGGPFLEVSRNLFNELNTNITDIRTSVIVDADESVINPNYETVVDYRNGDILVLGKYPGVTNLPLNNRVPVMRVAEMHFIKAEAQVAQGDIEGARTTINYLRARRISTGAAIAAADFDTAQKAYKHILNERRKELAFEGFRYIDLKRLGTLAGVNSIERYTRDCAPYSACELSVTDYRFTMPIPQDELNGNTIIATQQNPGY